MFLGLDSVVVVYQDHSIRGYCQIPRTTVPITVIPSDYYTTACWRPAALHVNC